MTGLSKVAWFWAMPLVLVALIAAGAGLGGALDLHRHLTETAAVVHSHSQSASHHHDELHSSPAPREVEVAHRSEPLSGEKPSEHPGGSDCDYLAIGSASPGCTGVQAHASLLRASADFRPVAVPIKTSSPARLAGARAPPVPAA